MMMTLRPLKALLHDIGGAMVVETAIILPVLAMLSIGGFEASSIVARQSELQAAAGEAAAIALAVMPDTVEERATVRDVIMASTGLPAEQVAVTEAYRCGTNVSMDTTRNSCGSDTMSVFVKIVLRDTYTPEWTQFGIGSPIAFSVVRTVQIG
jgi:Flp pilus assembly protein TadG